MALSDGDRRELERIAEGSTGEFGDSGRVEALRRFGQPDQSDHALLERARRTLDEKAGS